jgi:hypothetical protein
MFILANGKNSIGDRQVLAGNNSKNARRRERPGGIDSFYQRMGVMAAQDLCIDHPGQHDVVGKLCLASALCPRIDFAEWFANYFQRPFIFPIVRHSALVLFLMVSKVAG